jgi:TPR repeat protein
MRISDTMPRTTTQQISRFCIAVAICGCAVAISAAMSRAFALDSQPTPPGSASAALPLFKDPSAALREGLAGYRAGNFEASVQALQYAAQGGQSLAQWKLGQMYSAGDGVPHDDVKAFQYFSQIVASYDEDVADPRQFPVIASAFVSVGVYNLHGINNSAVKRNPRRAFQMFHYAATNFGDANAQYNLARMYLDGEGVEQDARQATRWLSNAADKNHMEAQALLGNMLFQGLNGLPRQRHRGLMYLTLAREAAGDRPQNSWIVDLYDSAIRNSDDFDKQAAHIELSRQLNKRSR